MQSSARYAGTGSYGTHRVAPGESDVVTRLARSHDPQQDQRLARALGWFSVGLGLTQLVMPRGVARVIGVRAEPNWLRVLGLRELANGIAILAQPRPSPSALQARVAGDAIDLGLMASAWNARSTDRVRLAAGAGVVLGVTALDILCSRRLSAALVVPRPLEIQTSIAIQSSPDKLYRFWRELSNLPRVFSHIDNIRVAEGGRFHVEGKRMLGRSLAWDAQITEDVINQRLGWHTLPGALIAHSARMQFKPLSAEGTLLSLQMRFEPLVPALVAPLARLLGDTPKQALKSELRRFKQWVEAGELATAEGPPAHGRALLS
jgi:uncharacterized membrane protein